MSYFILFNCKYEMPRAVSQEIEEVEDAIQWSAYLATVLLHIMQIDQMRYG